MLIDSHCHLQDKEFDEDREAVLKRGRAAGVEAFIVIGTDIESSERAIELAHRHDDVYATVGIHPHDAKNFDEETSAALRNLAADPKVVAIGEIGLDFYRNLSSPAAQRLAFRRQLELAGELGLPVSIHSRDADQETFAILQEFSAGAGGGRPTCQGKDALGIMHCFAGDLLLALDYVRLGFVISIAGTCTYPNAAATRTVAAAVPAEWLAVETDSPYLAPQGHRGKRNEPEYLRETAAFIAQLRNQRYEEFAAAATMATAELFAVARPSAKVLD